MGYNSHWKLAVNAVWIHIMKWLQVSEIFIGYHLSYTRENRQLWKYPTVDEKQGDLSGTCSGGQASNCRLQLDILSLWNPLANMFLGMIPNLIFWQEGGRRAPICCYLDSILPGRSGLFTPPEAWLSRPAHLQPEGAEVRHIRENRGQGGWVGRRAEVVQDATQVCDQWREGLLWNDRVFGGSGGKAGPNVWTGWLLREDTVDGWRLLDAVIVSK